MIKEPYEISALIPNIAEKWSRRVSNLDVKNPTHLVHLRKVMEELDVDPTVISDIILRMEGKLLSEIDTESELEQEISTYKQQMTDIEERTAQIQSILDDIESMEKKNKKRFKDIQKFMIRFKLDSRKVDQWIAKIEEKLKYAVVRPDYKKLWLEYQKKVNAATRKVMDAFTETHLEVKRKETVKALSIKAEGITDVLSGLWSKFKDLLVSFKSFNKVAAKQPKV